MKKTSSDPNDLICMIVPSFDRIGGYELQAFSLSKAYQHFGRKTFILTTHTPGLPHFEIKEEVEIHRLPRLVEKYRLLLPLYFSYLFKKFKKPPSLFHCHAISSFTENILQINQHLKIPAVLKVATQGDVSRLHSELLANEIQGPIRKRIYEQMTFLSINAHIQQELLDFNIRREKIFSIPNGVDTTRFSPPTPQEKIELKKELGFHLKENLITFTGRFEERKRVKDLIHAWANIEKGYPQHHLLLVGDGEERRLYEHLCFQLNISKRVTFFGLSKCVEKVLKISDLFVFPSRLEGLPNVILEAMATGLPILSTNIPGINEVIEHKKTGYLVPPQASSELIAGLHHLLQHPEQTKQLGIAAREQILSTYCFKKIAPSLFDLYTRLEFVRE